MAAALAERTPVSVILMRRLIPRALYPGRERVGRSSPTRSTRLRYTRCSTASTGTGCRAASVRSAAPPASPAGAAAGVVDGRGAAHLSPARAARPVQGARVMDRGPRDPGHRRGGDDAGRRYVELFGRLLMSMADGYVVHSDFDRAALRDSFAPGRGRSRSFATAPTPTTRSTASVAGCARPPRRCATCCSSARSARIRASGSRAGIRAAGRRGHRGALLADRRRRDMGRLDEARRDDRALSSPGADHARQPLRLRRRRRGLASRARTSSCCHTGDRRRSGRCTWRWTPGCP